MKVLNSKGGGPLEDKFGYEYRKFTGEEFKVNVRCILRITKSHTLKFIYYGRMAERCKNPFIKKLLSLRAKMLGVKCGIEIPKFENIGAGLLLCHAYAITLNENAKLGQDVTLFKGATVGSIRSGKHCGTPTIGDSVVIGLNAFVGGNVKIGSDVMIAPGAYVNFDVPDHSVVIGNPGVIHKKVGAADDYFTAYARKDCVDFVER